LAITLAELVPVLEALRDRAATAAPPTVMAMADTYRDHLKKVTLRRSFAAPGQFGTPAAPGSPPAWRTGELAKSVTTTPGLQSGLVATASVGPHTIYAATQEHGGVHFARRARYMHWVNSGGSWYLKRVDIPARPYMGPALDEVIGDGSLVKSAMEAFMATVWG
jgi:phage gpG-like protein